jgi:hypothetical protein
MGGGLKKYDFYPGVSHLANISESQANSDAAELSNQPRRIMWSNLKERCKAPV